MRPLDALTHPLVHSALTNISVDQHHMRPQTLTISNTTLVTYPAPGGPNDWDISVPYDTQAVIFSLRSNRTVELAGAKAGVIGVAGRSLFYTSTASLGGYASITSTAYNAIYSKAASALYLSDKIFSTTGDSILLMDAYLNATGPSTRVFKLSWQNYSASLATLDCRGELILLG